jgi:hypothetical protein
VTLILKATFWILVAHAYSPNTQKTEEKDHEFEASLGNIARPHLKKKKKTSTNQPTYNNKNPFFLVIMLGR